MRVLHMPHSIGGNAWNLSIGEKKNGLVSTVMIKDPTTYSNSCDIILKQHKLMRVFHLKALELMFFCIRVARKTDVVHYNWGAMLLQTRKFGLYGWDLKFFKKRHKVIAVTFQGSDARQAGFCMEHFDTTFYSKKDVDEQRTNDKFKADRIAFYEKHADLIYATNPDLLNILPDRAKFRPYTKLQPDEWIPCYSDYTKRKTTILHAPTKQNVKGTQYVDAAIERLKKEGYDIEYMLLQNIPNKEVIEYYKKADLVIDQLLVGWYGGFAVECMALGKPVMCYIRESDMRFIPPQMDRDMPIIRVTKDTLYDQMKEVLDNKVKLEKIAHDSRAYIEKWHDPVVIAKDIINDYRVVMERKLVN